MDNDVISVLFGGPSVEHEISILTGLQCEHILRKAGHNVNAIYWGRNGAFYLVPPMSEARDYLE
jgi:D-alanine-D-alanine ligase